MTLPESTVAKVREAIISAEWLLRKIGESTEADKCQSALNLLDSAPPPAMGGLPELPRWIHPEMMHTILRVDLRSGELGKHQGFHDRMDSCAELGCLAVEICSPGTRDRLGALEGALKSYAECGDGCTCGDGWSHQEAIDALAGSKK